MRPESAFLAALLGITFFQMPVLGMSTHTASWRVVAAAAFGAVMVIAMTRITDRIRTTAGASIAALIILQGNGMQPGA